VVIFKSLKAVPKTDLRAEPFFICAYLLLEFAPNAI
jgi:hypothetical protein